MNYVGKYPMNYVGKYPMNYVGKYPRCDAWIFQIFVNVLVRHIRTDVRK
jgi:hypothetical protein